MDAVHSTVHIPRSDRELMKRFTVIALFLLFLTAAFSHLFRFYTRRLEDFTGSARWIWASHQISRNVPVVFFAAREFDLPATRAFTHAKIFADPEYALWFNGRELAGRRGGDDARNLDVYDLFFARPDRAQQNPRGRAEHERRRRSDRQYRHRPRAGERRRDGRDLENLQAVE